MPTSAITKNNAGIVEAIKRKSGSTKFYKPSFEGIIEAILDWNGSGSGDGSGTGGGGATVLPIGGTPPSTGNTDGDMVIIPNADGDYFIYVFANGAWEKINVTTEEVLPSGSAPMAITAPDGTVLSNQKDINNYLDKLIKELQELEGYDDAAIRKLIEDLQKEVDALPVTVADKAPDGEDGDLWFDTTGDDLQLFVSYEGEWVVASPPVSTEDIENSILEIQEILQAADALQVQRGNQIAALQSNIYNVASAVAAIDDQIGRVLFIGDAPPSPEGVFDLWYDTVRLELCVWHDEAWYPSSPNSGGGGGGNQDLQSVLDKGNTSTTPIGIQSENGEIAIINPDSVEIQAITAPKVKLLDIADFETMEVGMDEDHGHISLSNPDDVLHFKFGGTEKVTFKGKGDAEFLGRVIAQPGHEDNEVVTVAQLTTLEKEIEQIQQSADRGIWDFKKDESPNKGHYGLIREFLDEDAQENLCQEELIQCQLDAAGSSSALSDCNREFNKCMGKIDGGKWLLTDDWEKAEQIAFAFEDDEDAEHTFEYVEVGMYIDVFNTDDKDYMVAQITSKSITDDGMRCNIKVLKSMGEADGRALVKFYKIAEGDPTNYVQKTGDEMSGTLVVKPDSGKYGLIVNSGPEAVGTANDILSARTYDNRPVFFADEKMDVGVNTGWTPTKSHHLATKGYADSMVPIGTVIFWAGLKTKIPEGFTECRGQNASASVKEKTGLSQLPDLRNYMPAGVGGVFGTPEGTYKDSKIKSHNHYVERLEPGSTQGNPDGSSDSSSSRYRYWRGNKDANGSNGTNVAKKSSTVGDGITAPPVYLGVWIMRTS